MFLPSAVAILHGTSNIYSCGRHLDAELAVVAHTATDWKLMSIPASHSR